VREVMCREWVVRCGERQGAGDEVGGLASANDVIGNLRNGGEHRMVGAVELTLAGSSPMTPGVQPNPDPSARLTRFFATVVLPEQGGPTTITLGPRPVPFPTCPDDGWPLPVVEVERRARMRRRSRARCREMSAGCVVEPDEYCETGSEETDISSQLACRPFDPPSSFAGVGEYMLALRYRCSGYQVTGGSSSELMYTGSGL